MGILTLGILVLCLFTAGFGVGDESFKILHWDRKSSIGNNANINDTSQSLLNYELKPVRLIEKMVYYWDDSLDFYDISANITNVSFNFEETREFLERYHCEILIPNLVTWYVPASWSKGGHYETYTVSIPNCSPEK